MDNHTYHENEPPKQDVLVTLPLFPASFSDSPEGSAFLEKLTINLRKSLHSTGFFTQDFEVSFEDGDLHIRRTSRDVDESGRLQNAYFYLSAQIPEVLHALLAERGYILDMEVGHIPGLDTLPPKEYRAVIQDARREVRGRMAALLHQLGFGSIARDREVTARANKIVEDRNKPQFTALVRRWEDALTEHQAEIMAALRRGK